MVVSQAPDAAQLCLGQCAFGSNVQSQLSSVDRDSWLSPVAGVACIAARTPQQIGGPELSHFEYRSCRMTLSLRKSNHDGCNGDVTPTSLGNV